MADFQQIAAAYVLEYGDSSVFRLPGFVLPALELPEGLKDLSAGNLIDWTRYEAAGSEIAETLAAVRRSTFHAALSRRPCLLSRLQRALCHC